MLPFGLGRRKSTVGLDVGSGFLKASVIDHSKDIPQLEKVAVSPIEGDAIVDGDIVDPGLVADAISSMFEREKIDQRDVVIGVGGRDVIIKLIKMDRMDEEEAREVIPWEAEQHREEVLTTALAAVLVMSDGEGDDEIVGSKLATALNLYPKDIRALSDQRPKVAKTIERMML